MTAFSLFALALMQLGLLIPKFGAKPTESEIRHAIVGTWFKEEPFQYYEKTYFANGTASGFWVERNFVDGAWQDGERVSFSSSWEVEGDILVIFDIRSSTEDIFDPDDVIHDRVIKINRRYAKFEDVDSGSVFVRYRKTETSGSPD